jgi:hypothetical protein
VAGDLPRCLDMITADDVIRRIEMYYAHGQLSYAVPQMRPLALVV